MLLGPSPPPAFDGEAFFELLGNDCPLTRLPAVKTRQGATLICRKLSREASEPRSGHEALLQTLHTIRGFQRIGLAFKGFSKVSNVWLFLHMHPDGPVFEDDDSD